MNNAASRWEKKHWWWPWISLFNPLFLYDGLGNLVAEVYKYDGWQCRDHGTHHALTFWNSKEEAMREAERSVLF